MRAVSPGRSAVQDMDTDHGRLLIVMAEKLLNRADIVAPSSRGVTDNWSLWGKTGPTAEPPGRSAPGCEAEENGGKAEVTARMSARGYPLTTVGARAPGADPRVRRRERQDSYPVPITAEAL